MLKNSTTLRTQLLLLWSGAVDQLHILKLHRSRSYILWLGFGACSSAESFLQANTDLKTEVDVARAGQRFAEYERFKINQMNIARYSPHQ